jgi:phosphorylase/glycogen(starch) synthase
MNIGNTKLYLLDTDIPENTTEDRLITSNLYGGDLENRLRQEILLGIGGVRLLNLLEYRPDVYHINEGHAAFVSFERINRFILEENISFDEALEVVRASSLFTTHTPVEAGHDRFNEDLMRKYFSHYPQIFNITWEKLIGFGKVHEHSNEEFSMSYFAARFSQKINAVSKIHEIVSKRIFNKLWGGYGEEEVPVSHVTNGVHQPTWMANEWKQLFNEKLGQDLFNKQQPSDVWSKVMAFLDDDIWQTHKSLKKKLIERIKIKVKWDLQSRNDNTEKLHILEETLKEDALYIGFARRFASYKRSELIFKNIKTLTEIVNNKDRPVVFIFAGKAHPNDLESQQHIKNIFNTINDSSLNGKIILLENYNMEIAKYMVQGVDLWLNTPVMGEEASGTSGIKASINGVLNFSVKDGWYPEAFNENLGWALPDNDFTDIELRDKSDAELIYRMLKNEIIPMYFDRDKDGLPANWIKKMKHSIAAITPAFSSMRMADEYFKNYYQPLNILHQEFAANHFERAEKVVEWKQKIARYWDKIKVVSINEFDTTANAFALGKEISAKIILDITGLDASDIGVEVIFRNKKDSEVNPSKIVLQQDFIATHQDKNIVTYEYTFTMDNSGVFEYGFRIYPKSDLLINRMDFCLMKWI